jgi:hypothetical protein
MCHKGVGIDDNLSKFYLYGSKPFTASKLWRKAG